MDTLQIKPIQTLKVGMKSKLIAAMRLTNFMDFSEVKFFKFIKEIESSPLFKKLRRKKLVSYKRLRSVDLSRSFLEFKEEISRDYRAIDIESLLKGKEKVVQIIRKLGVDKFKQYFLYNESNLSLKEISKGTGLEVSNIKGINHLIDEISIHSEFYHPSVISSRQGIRYFKIASIEKTDSNNFIIGYFSPDYIKGRYWIDYEKIEEFKKNNFFSKRELKKINRLLKNLGMINIRKTTIHRIIQSIIEVQSDYLNSEDVGDLRPFTQKELSKKLKINPSLICRSISNKSIDTPWEEEKPLKEFFPNKKEIRKILIREIISNAKKCYTDEIIKNKLRDNFGILVSRRSVNVYRRELGINAAYKKNKRE